MTSPIAAFRDGAPMAEATDGPTSVTGEGAARIPCLWDLLAPMSAQQFLSDYWQKAPLHRAAPSPHLYDPLLRLSQVDDVLHAAAANAGEFDYYAAGASVPQSDYTAAGNYVQLNRLLGLYAKGGTLHVSNIQKYVRALGRFCKRAQADLLADCEADFWLTRRNDFTPYLHFDRYDIFILQIHGRKRWRLFAPMAIPDARQGAGLAWEEVGEPVIDVVVGPGDLIYIPPHTPHVVTTEDEHSLHVGIGVHPLTWRQVLDAALDEVRSRPNALSDVVPPDFLQALLRSPTGLIETLMAHTHAALERVDTAALTGRLHGAFIDNVTHADDAHVLRQIVDAQPVAASTVLVRRDFTPGRAYIAADGRAAMVYAGGGTMTAPANYLAAFQAILSRDGPFTARDLDPSLDLDSRVTLLRRAVDAGLCRRA